MKKKVVAMLLSLSVVCAAMQGVAQAECFDAGVSKALEPKDINTLAANTSVGVTKDVMDNIKLTYEKNENTKVSAGIQDEFEQILEDTEEAIDETETTEVITTEEETEISTEAETENVDITEEETETETTVTEVNSIFSDTALRLNQEIYDVSAEVINDLHAKDCYEDANTALWNSYKENLTPYAPMALAIVETGNWNDTRYTWCPAIYSGPLASAGVDMDGLHIYEVNSDTYYAAGLSSYLSVAKNDADSLGPLQVLRHYVEKKSRITYGCGEVCADLMDWKDNVEYMYHTQSKNFASNKNWNKDYTISNEYEVVALLGVGHNTGSAYQCGRTGGSYWRSADAVYKYCHAMATDEAIRAAAAFIDNWYENEVVPNVEAGKAFKMPSQMGHKGEVKLLKAMGVNGSDYATSMGHKQYYPLKALLNYLGLKKLYRMGY